MTSLYITHNIRKHLENDMDPMENPAGAHNIW